MYFPGLSLSGSGSRVLYKGRLGWACILCPPQIQAAQVTRCLASTVTPSCGLQLIASPVPATWFSGCTTGAPRCAMCHFWGADLWLRSSQQKSTVQNPKKSWLAMKPGCSLVDDASLGPRLPPSGSGCPHLPVSGGRWAGLQPTSSAQSFVL